MSQYAYTDDAPFAVAGNVHDNISVTTAVATLGTATGSAGVPSFAETNGTVRYPKAVYLCCVNPAHDVWVTWDGQAPVVGTTAPLGVKLPPTYPSLRIPCPAVIRADGIKILSDQAGGAPVVMVWEF